MSAAYATDVIIPTARRTAAAPPNTLLKEILKFMIIVFYKVDKLIIFYIYIYVVHKKSAHKYTPLILPLLSKVNKLYMLMT